MKYFIAHLLSGDAKQYHAGLTRRLALKYRVTPLHERIPPHVTIKPPFETDELGIKEVERVLRSFVRSEPALPLVIDGFGRFGFRTIYLDVYKSGEVVSLVRRLIHTLNTNISWMPAYPLEGNKLHASVARFLDRRQFRRIWRELRTLSPRFESTFDTIAILKKEGRSWEIHSQIPLAFSDESFHVNGSLSDLQYVHA
ncbi:MAG: 2'-5' RNA ligase family protein [Patescibacteria group bacterium]